jgi:hypothetical protein
MDSIQRLHCADRVYLMLVEQGRYQGLADNKPDNPKAMYQGILLGLGPY